MGKEGIALCNSFDASKMLSWFFRLSLDGKGNVGMRSQVEYFE